MDNGLQLAQALDQKLRDRSARIGVVGLGYVGLPLGIEFARKGFCRYRSRLTQDLPSPKRRELHPGY